MSKLDLNPLRGVVHDVACAVARAMPDGDWHLDSSMDVAMWSGTYDTYILLKATYPLGRIPGRIYVEMWPRSKTHVSADVCNFVCDSPDIIGWISGNANRYMVAKVLRS